MPAADTASRMSPANRLGLTLFLATVIHGMVILGVSFGYNIKANAYVPPTLDVVLVQTRAERAPEEAEFLAQADQQASGSADAGRPSSPFTAPNPLPTGGTAPMRLEAAGPRRPDTPQVRTLTTQKSETTLPRPEDTRKPRPEKRLTGPELMERSLQIARLSAEIREREQRYAKRPRVHYIDAVGAKSAVEASYVEAWVRRVERMGTLNYPDEALRRRLSGRLIVNVLIDRNGEVVNAEIAESSGHQVLDDAALRIVRLGAPYAPFPLEMRKNYDQLMITRTWVFHSDSKSLITESGGR